MPRRLTLGLPVAVAALAAACLGTLYGLSERRLREFTAPPAFDRPVATDLATIARGEHLARTRGCLSCHGSNLEGRDWGAEWAYAGRPVAPNLARYARDESPATLERAIRHGIGRDGRALFSMPSYNFRHLTDDDLAALIAYLRAHPVFAHELPVPYLSLPLRLALVRRTETHAAEWAAATPPLLTDSARDPAQVVRGEYLAMTACNECHGLDVRGARFFGDTVPDLAVVAGYTPEELRRLLRQGAARDGRTDLGLMTTTARNRFVHLTEGEIDDLHAFLKTLPGRPVPPVVFWRQ